MKILFFSPNSAVSLFAHAEAVFANSLQKAGNEILYITCGRLYQVFCTSMMAHNLSFDSSEKQKAAVCNLCCNQATLLRKSFDLMGYDLKEHVSPEDRNYIAKLTESGNQEQIVDFSLDSVNIGRIALYEFLINHKKNSLTFSDTEWKMYLTLFRNTLTTYLAAKRIISKEKPDHIIMYNSLYVANHAFRAAGEKADIPVYQIHATENLAYRDTRIFITRQNTYFFRKQLKEAWPTFSKYPRGIEILSEVTAHLEELFSAKSLHVYSSAKGQNVGEQLGKYGVSKSQKLIVATLSSYDERFAGEECGALERVTDSIFNSQIEWVKDLIAFFKENPDLFLLIRVHPREFPNRREQTKSEHATQLAREFTKLPKNVKINWPEDGISLYDLAEHTDLILNAWSSAGEEMTLFGIPVLLFSKKFIMYASEINHVATEKEAYFRKIRELASQNEDLSYVTNAFRWYAMKMHDTSFPILRQKRFSFFWKTVADLHVFTIRIVNKLFQPRFFDLHFVRMMHQNMKSVNVKNVMRLLEANANTLLDIGKVQDDPILLGAEREYILEYYRRQLTEAMKSPGDTTKFRERLMHLLGK